MAKLLKITPTPTTCETTLAKIEATRKAIYDRRQGKPFEINISEIIHQMREERDRQLLEATQSKSCWDLHAERSPQ